QLLLTDFLEIFLIFLFHISFSENHSLLENFPILQSVFEKCSSMIFYFNSQRQPAGNKINHICGFGVARVYYDITSHNGKNHTYGLFLFPAGIFLA
uniref:hypothetical protein n=1 Tax=Anaerobutyricum hallii TaxID=39488 RepID=UPI003FEF1F2B